MGPDIEIPLWSGIKLLLYSEKTGSEKTARLEKMIKLASTFDFLDEVKTMKKIDRSLPMTLLVYDDFIILGACNTKSRLSVGMRPYSDLLLKNWTDLALSLMKHPIRIVNKTEKENFSERLKPRTELDWIEYDSQSQIMGEIKDRPCLAQKFLEAIPLTRDLYSVREFDGQVEALHIKLLDYTDETRKEDKLIITKGVVSKGEGTQVYDLPIKNVENMLKEMHPEARVIRPPLLYCASAEKGLHACLGRLFEKAYAKQLGFEGDTLIELGECPEEYTN